MKGFIKDGKFRPTGNRTKSALSKKDFETGYEIPKKQRTVATKRIQTILKKRKDESIDDVSSDLTDDDREKIKRMVGTGTNKEEKHTGETITQEGEVKEIKRYVAFNPSSSDSLEWWTEDTIAELVWNLRHIHEVSGTLIAYEKDGLWGFEHLEIYDITKHPKLIEEMKANWQS